MATAESTVTYRDIPGFPGYRVGDDGSVWSCRKRVGLGHRRGSAFVLSDDWRRLVPVRGPSSCTVKLTGSITFRVHRLVLEAFVGACPAGMECCHNDGDFTNNAVSNLRWDTRKANMADKTLHGTQPRGAGTGVAKLTEEKVRDARIRFASGEVTRAELARELNVTWQTLQAALMRRTWKQVV